MIWNFVPYCPREMGDPHGCDLGFTYNAYMDLIPEDDWACFMDHDTLVTSRSWYRVLEAAVESEPDAGAFVAVTNRLVKARSGWQMAPEADHDNHDVIYHWKIGYLRERKYGASLQDVTDIESKGRYKPFSGFFFCVSKKTWIAMGGCKKHDFCSVDHYLHREIKKTGKKVYLLNGIYLYHWYRCDEKLSDMSHASGPVSIGGKKIF